MTLEDLRLADGTPVRIVGELPTGEWIPLTSHDPRATWDFTEIDVYVDETDEARDTLIAADVSHFAEMMIEHYTQPEVCFYVDKHRYWQLQYAAQGKLYPSPKKRKNQARMSRKWRTEA